MRASPFGTDSKTDLAAACADLRRAKAPAAILALPGQESPPNQAARPAPGRLGRQLKRLLIFSAILTLLVMPIAMLGIRQSQKLDSSINQNNAAQHAGAGPEQMSQGQQDELVAMARANGMPQGVHYWSQVRGWAALSAPAHIPQPGSGEMGAGPIPPGQPLTAQQEVMAWACEHRAPEWVAVSPREREFWVAAECSAGRANLIVRSQPVQAAQPEVRRALPVEVRRAILVKMP